MLVIRMKLPLLGFLVLRSADLWLFWLTAKSSKLTCSDYLVALP